MFVRILKRQSILLSLYPDWLKCIYVCLLKGIYVRMYFNTVCFDRIGPFGNKLKVRDPKMCHQILGFVTNMDKYINYPNKNISIYYNKLFILSRVHNGVERTL